MDCIDNIICFVIIFAYPFSVVCRCPTNAILYKGESSCYYISENSRLTWAEGQLKCEEMGGNLLVISSNNEEDWVSWLLRQKVDRNNTRESGYRWWIGLSKTDGQWQWINGQPANIDTLFWHVSEPSFAPDRDACVEFRQFLLNDVDCGQVRDVICEFQSDVDSTETMTPSVVSTTPNAASPEVDMMGQKFSQRRWIFFGIISGIALLALVSIMAVICLAVRVRRLRRTYLTPQSSVVGESRSVQERAPETLPRRDPTRQHRFVLTTDSYAEPIQEQHPGYEKLNHFSPRYLELTH